MNKEDQALSHYRYTDQHFIDRHMPFPEEDGFLSGYRAACEAKDKRIAELEADVEYWRSHYLRLNMESEGGADD